MKYHCNECGCEFYYYASKTTDEPKCPQCDSNNVRLNNGTCTDASEC